MSFLDEATPPAELILDALVFGDGRGGGALLEFVTEDTVVAAVLGGPGGGLRGDSCCDDDPWTELELCLLDEEATPPATPPW